MKSEYNCIEKLTDFFFDSTVNEILLNSINSLCICTTNCTQTKNSPFEDIKDLTRNLQAFAFNHGIRLDPLLPSNGGILDINGTSYRWHCLLPPISQDGPIFSLRRHRFCSLTIDDFQISSHLKENINRIMEEKKPIIICGPTGSGKTTFLIALLKLHCLHERVFCLEQIPELPLLSNQWIRLVERHNNTEGVGGYTLSQVLTDSLRLRPDRLIIGEIRSSEGSAFLNSIDSGHKGVLTTMHAASASQALRRLQTLSKDTDILTILKESRTAFCILDRGSPPTIKSIDSIYD